MKKGFTLKVNDVYVGNAAQLFIEKLNDTSSNLTDILDQILEECIKKTNAKGEEYANQEAKMKNSLGSE